MSHQEREDEREYRGGPLKTRPTQTNTQAGCEVAPCVGGIPGALQELDNAISRMDDRVNQMGHRLSDFMRGEYPEPGGDLAKEPSAESNISEQIAAYRRQVNHLAVRMENYLERLDF